MDVGAIQKGDKGKKGKKGKSESKGVNKGGKWDKASGKGPQSTKKFQGECSHCGKWGDKKADCRILAKEKPQREKEKGRVLGKVPMRCRPQIQRRPAAPTLSILGWSRMRLTEGLGQM